MMRTLIVASSNLGKVREMEAYLSQFDWKWGLMPPGLEVEETGTTFAENACLKASVVAKATGEWAIADDSGLAVDALDGAPGIYSARYAATDSERIARVLSELGNTDCRSAQFVCAIAIARPDGSIAVQVEGICPGEILREPRGTEGFGYDPIFYVPEWQMTFAQMPPEVKHEISHRARAFAALLARQSALD